MSARVLLVDDDPAFVEALALHLERRGYDVTTAESAAAARHHVATSVFDAAILDQRLPDGDGLTLARTLRARGDGTPVVLVTAFAGVPEAVEAIRAGVYQYLEKPIDLSVLEATLERCVAEASTTRASRERCGVEAWIGASPLSDRVRAQLRLGARAAPSPVLLLGETGTGKSLAARIIHSESPVAAGPFLSVSCAALPEALFESELFGHEKGAFTGAQRTRPGLIEAAAGGTLFLDEIAEMPMALQAKLLTALDDGEVRRVGSNTIRRTNARIIAATHRSITQMVADGTFRADLYFRLSVFPVVLPPLRQRSEDLPALLDAALADVQPTPSAEERATLLSLMRAHEFPGNVRELRNLAHRWAILRRAGADALRELLAVALPPPRVNAAPPRSLDAANSLPSRPSPADGRFLTLEEVEWQHIRAALERSRGNRTAAARLLGISRSTLNRKLAGDSAETRAVQASLDARRDA